MPTAWLVPRRPLRVMAMAVGPQVLEVVAPRSLRPESVDVIDVGRGLDAAVLVLADRVHPQECRPCLPPSGVITACCCTGATGIAGPASLLAMCLTSR